jgi:eukaryotic-like serine/threonine-protein kinase
MSLAPGDHLGPFEIAAPIGEGGMGKVYLAHDTNLKRDVAIKVLPDSVAHDAERLARFEREARLLAALNHPNIAHIHGLEKHDGTMALVMELVEGPTLADRIAQGPMSVDEALPIARQITQALAAAHDQGIIHRDLKPANVKIREDGTVKVLDFGLAKALDRADALASASPSMSPTITSPAMTQAGLILGTAAYMSPEQARGRTVDRRADIWAFGVVLYEMVTGTRLFEGEDLTETLASVVKEQPDLSAVPAPLRRLLGRCLEKDPRKRLRDIGDVWELLSEDAPVAATHMARPSRWAWIVAAAAAVVALAALAFVYLRPAPPPPAVYEFTMALPPNMTAHSYSLSPDGLQVALALASSPGEPGQLWVRALNTDRPRALPDTEDARYPFWSPDGHYIAFFAQGKLKKIAVSGGPAQTLCNADSGRGGTWNANGVILFAPGPFAQIQRVAEGGGTPVDVTKARTSGTQPARRFPSFLPDGRHFLYTDSAADPGSVGIYLASIDGGEPRRLLPDDSNAAYAAGPGAGAILFARESTLMAQPFDPDRLALTGDVFPVSGDLGGTANRGFFSFSTDAAGSLLHLRGANQNVAPVRQLAWVDRSGQVLETLGRPERIGDLALSPDGTRAALGIFESAGTSEDLWVLDLARGVKSKLTTAGTASHFPVWSPDGTQIAYSAERSGAAGLYVADAGGAQGEKLLLPPTVNALALDDWSGDGRFLLYETQNPRTGFDLLAFSLEQGAKPAGYLTTEFNERAAQFSPDGRWVAYGSNESTHQEIYVRPFPAADRKVPISTNGGLWPRWSHDGHDLYYLKNAPDSALMVVSVGGGATITPGPPRVLFKISGVSGPGTAPLYVPARDGRRFLMASAVDENGTPGGAPAAADTLVFISNWRAKVAGGP